MNRMEHIDPEVLKLLAAVCDGTASQEQLTRLEEMLAGDPSGLRLYFEYCQLESDLYLVEGANHATQQTLWQIDSLIARRPLVSRAAGAFGRPASMSIVVAAIVIGLLITTMALMAPPFYRAISSTEEGPAEPAALAVAELAGTRGAVWAEGQIGATLGARLPQGHQMQLLEGLVLVHFYSGADVTIEGPATFVLQGEDVLRLNAGRTSVMVPPEAVGFRVASADAEAVDLGTQFGMIADPSRTEMHVFEGRVEARLFDTEGATVYTTELKAGQSLSWSSKTKSRQIAKADPTQFVEFLPHDSVAILPNLGPQQKLVPVSKIGSQRATSGSGAKLATFNGKTHIVWQDSLRQGYLSRAASYDHATGELSKATTLHLGKGNQERPVITVDKNGYLHVVISGHNSPLSYRRSLRPNDTSEWSEPEPAGSGTYPILACGEDGTLYLTMRASAQWDGSDFYTKPPDGPWRQTAKLVKRDPKMPGFAGFSSGLAWGPGHQTLHVVTDFYEGLGVYEQRGLHQAVCCMQSDDRGKTWQKANGKPVKVPARPERMDILARDIGTRDEPQPPPVVLSQGNIVVDPQGRPHVLYVSHVEEPGALVHATLDDDRWRQTTIEVVKKRYPQMRPMGCRGALTIDEDGKLYALLELIHLSTGWKDGKPVREGRDGGQDKKLVWLTSRDSGKTFDVAPALNDGMEFHQANVEHPTGFNNIPGGKLPPFLYFDGNPSNVAQGEVVHNNVYLVVPR